MNLQGRHIGVWNNNNNNNNHRSYLEFRENRTTRSWCQKWGFGQGDWASSSVSRSRNLDPLKRVFRGKPERSIGGDA